MAAVAAAEGAAAVATERAAILGAGLGWRAQLGPGILQQRARIDVLEIVADHFLDAPAETLAELDLLRAHFTIIPHALDLSLGSADGVDGAYLERLAALIARLDPPWWSEHLAFTRAGGVRIGHLMPLPRTRGAVAVVARNVAQVARTIRSPLLLENSAALFTLPGAMDPAEFLHAVVDATGCGLLLDLANLHADAVNHGGDARALLARLPVERVAQLHLAGGDHERGVLVDSHASAVAEPVWELAEEVLARAPVRAAILERDARFAGVGPLLDELDRLRACWPALRAARA